MYRIPDSAIQTYHKPPDQVPGCSPHSVHHMGGATGILIVLSLVILFKPLRDRWRRKAILLPNTTTATVEGELGSEENICSDSRLSLAAAAVSKGSSNNQVGGIRKLEISTDRREYFHASSIISEPAHPANTPVLSPNPESTDIDLFGWVVICAFLWVITFAYMGEPHFVNDDPCAEECHGQYNCIDPSSPFHF